LAGDPAAHNRISWMAYITQAGVGLGLAKEVAGAFPDWGAAFAAMMISIIVLNQLIGPALFKAAINLAHEAHPGAKKSDAGATHSALIFGADGQALALARQLRLHDWEVRVARQHSGETKLVEGSDIPVYPVPDYSLASLREIGAGGVGAIVSMLSDEDNYAICETAFEHFGDANLVVQLNNRANHANFRELGAFVVTPSTAIVSLLDHYVRSPSAVSLLLGMESGHDIIDMEVRNPGLRWVPLRELRFPRDILILSFTRDGRVMKVSGHTQFQEGDLITVSGSLDSLEEVALRLSG
jgi:Trk K+ transport system NAD-binding subunit